jgi:hypothetical protein
MRCFDPFFYSFIPCATNLFTILIETYIRGPATDAWGVRSGVGVCTYQHQGQRRAFTSQSHDSNVQSDSLTRNNEEHNTRAPLFVQACLLHSPRRRLHY